MAKLPTVKVTCTDSGTTVDADVIHQSRQSIKVAFGVGEHSITVVLTKDTPTSKYYIGSKFGMEFTTTGDEV